MKQFRRGQIWLVNFDPSFGHEYKKVRPALIVEHDKYIASSAIITLIPISSQTAKQADLDILLKKDAYNRLIADSLIKTVQISSFDKRRLIKFVGTVAPEIMALVAGNIQLLLA